MMQDDTKFFLNEQKSITELMKTLKLFSKVSGLKPRMLKCEVVWTGSLKGVKMAVFDIKYIDLITETTKEIGAHFCYNQKLEIQKTFVKRRMEYEKYHTGGENNNPQNISTV